MLTTRALIAGIESRYPQVKLALDPVELPTGSTWIDLTADGKHVTIEWRHGVGLGLHIGRTDDFCIGPDEIYNTLDAMLLRLDTIFTPTT